MEGSGPAVAGTLSAPAGAAPVNWGAIAPLVLAMSAAMLALGYGLARLLRADRRQSVTVAIESSVQNATLAIVIGSTIMKDETLVVPGAIYGLMMYVTSVAFVFIARRMLPPAPRA